MMRAFTTIICGAMLALTACATAPNRSAAPNAKAWGRGFTAKAKAATLEKFGPTRLGPGDFVLYDNYRMLHARTAFRGARWFRGVYFDRH